ncbi:MAG: ABC transporter permease [Deltaproteobacteria bacterium]|nr:ABC transporter permease [Deltaproteobacteria bacterium]
MFRILPTDIFIFILVAAAIIFIFSARRREYWRNAWRQVRTNNVAMISLLVLSLYASIALLDSVHFIDKKSGTTLSMLDRMVTPLHRQVEKTYSAPFATHQYTKESVEGRNGKITHLNPRLIHGGAHLTQTTSKARDITTRVLKGVVQGSIVAIILAGIILGLYDLFHRIFIPTLPLPEVRKKLSKQAVLTLLMISFAVSISLFILIEVAPHYHIFGTDKVGGDVFYRSIKSIRTGLVIGSVTTLIVIPFAIFFGVIAGYFGGIVDDSIQYIYSTLASIPSVLLIVSFMLLIEVGEDVLDIAWRADRRLLSLCIIMGITSWTGLCRLIRGETLKLRELEYVQAALSFGVNRLRILSRHIVPNLMHIVLISFILRFSGLVLAEAVLAYIGIGVDPSMESWGNMINTARLELAREPVVWWNLVAAFFFMFGLVLPANLFGDALRDALDPRLKT